MSKSAFMNLAPEVVPEVFNGFVPSSVYIPGLNMPRHTTTVSPVTMSPNPHNPSVLRDARAKNLRPQPDLLDRTGMNVFKHSELQVNKEQNRDLFPKFSQEGPPTLYDLPQNLYKQVLDKTRSELGKEGLTIPIPKTEETFLSPLNSPVDGITLKPKNPLKSKWGTRKSNVQTSQNEVVKESSSSPTPVEAKETILPIGSDPKPRDPATEIELKSIENQPQAELILPEQKESLRDMPGDREKLIRKPGKKHLREKPYTPPINAKLDLPSKISKRSAKKSLEAKSLENQPEAEHPEKTPTESISAKKDLHSAARGNASKSVHNFLPRKPLAPVEEVYSKKAEKIAQVSSELETAKSSPSLDKDMISFTSKLGTAPIERLVPTLSSSQLEEISPKSPVNPLGLLDDNMIEKPAFPEEETPDTKKKKKKSRDNEEKKQRKSESKAKWEKPINPQKRFNQLNNVHDALKKSVDELMRREFAITEPVSLQPKGKKVRKGPAEIQDIRLDLGQTTTTNPVVSEPQSALGNLFGGIGSLFNRALQAVKIAPPKELVYGEFAGLPLYRKLLEKELQLPPLKISDKETSEKLNSVEKLLGNICFRTSSSLTTEEESLKGKNIEQLKKLALTEDGEILEYLAYFFLTQYEFEHGSKRGNLTEYKENLRKFIKIEDFASGKYTKEELLAIAEGLINFAKIKDITLQEKAFALNKANFILSNEEFLALPGANILLEKATSLAKDLEVSEGVLTSFDLMDRNLLKKLKGNSFGESAAIYRNLSELFSKPKDNKNQSSQISAILKNCGDNEAEKALIYDNLRGLFKNLKDNFDSEDEEVKKDLEEIYRNIELVPLEIIFGESFKDNPLIRRLTETEDGRNFLANLDLTQAKKLNAIYQENYSLLHGLEANIGEEQEILRKFFNDNRSEAENQEEKKRLEALKENKAKEESLLRDEVNFLKNTATPVIISSLSGFQQNAERMIAGEIISTDLLITKKDIVKASFRIAQVGAVGGIMAGLFIAFRHPQMAYNLVQRSFSLIYNQISLMTLIQGSVFGSGSLFIFTYFDKAKKYLTPDLGGAKNAAALYGVVGIAQDAANMVYGTINTQQIERMNNILKLLSNNPKEIIDILLKEKNMQNFGVLFQGKHQTNNLIFLLRILVLNIDHRMTSGTASSALQKIFAKLINFNDVSLEEIKTVLEKLFEEGITIPRDNYLNIFGNSGTNQTGFIRQVEGEPTVTLSLQEIVGSGKNLSEIVREKFSSANDSLTSKDMTGIKSLLREITGLSTEKENLESEKKEYFSNRRAKISSIIGLVAAPSLAIGSIIFKSAMGMTFWPSMIFLPIVSLASLAVLQSRKNLSIFSDGQIGKKYEEVKNQLAAKEAELSNKQQEEINKADKKRQEFFHLPTLQEGLASLEVGRNQSPQATINRSFFKTLSSLPKTIVNSFTSGAGKVGNFLLKAASFLGVEVKASVHVRKDDSFSQPPEETHRVVQQKDKSELNPPHQ